MAVPLLRLQGVSKYYTGEHSVVLGLNSVNLTLSAGEFVAFSGESGSGKSTLTHILAGVLPYEAGEMFFNGKPTSHYDGVDWERYRCENIALISQSYGILPGATVWSNVLSALYLTGMSRKDAAPKAEQILKQVEARFILVEIHAEATSEKLAMGYMLDGRVSAVWGTHTHVPTADARVLPKGTGYVTDLGMTGPRDSVLGIRPELSIAKFRGDLPERYRWAEGASKIEAVLFTIDSETGKCRKAERVDKWD